MEVWSRGDTVMEACNSCKVWRGVGWLDHEKPIRGSYRCGVWRSVNMGWDKFFQNIQFAVVFGDQVCFCHDCWCGDQLLKMDMIIPLVLKL